MQDSRLRIAIVGGGINGVMTAWELARRNCDVVLYERTRVMGETSSASTKLLHGGLRYLEHGSFRLVRESLRERTWWLQQAPHLTSPLRFVIPVRAGMSRSKTRLRLGLWIYDALAGTAALERHAKHDAEETSRLMPELRIDGLMGGLSYMDVQMDDLRLGQWAAARAAEAGVRIRTGKNIECVSIEGDVETSDGVARFDRVVNATGPWAAQLLERSGVSSAYQLRLVRGSHLIVERQVSNAVLMQVPEDRRVVFAIPWRGKVLLGTTEVEQDKPGDAECSTVEEKYLLSVWERYFTRRLESEEICERFAGVRPLIREKSNPAANTREFALERTGRLITVFGGKWTTARVLGQRAASLALST